MARALLFLAAASCSLVQAQDDPVETREFDIQFLTRPLEDAPGESVGIVSDAIGTTVAAGESGRWLYGDAFAELIKKHLEPESWENAPMSLASRDGVLTATHRRSVLANISGFIDAWRRMAGKMVVLDAAIVAVDPPAMARIRAAGNADRPGVLTADQRRRLLEGKSAEVVRTMRLTARPGQRVSLQELVKRQYVRDFDVQIASADGTLDPVVDVLSTGPSVDVRPFVEPTGGFTLEVRMDRVEFEALDERRLRIPKDLTFAGGVETEAGKPPVPAKGGFTRIVLDQKVQLPKVQHDRIRTTVSVRDRETAVAASLLRLGREHLFLLTPAVVTTEEKAMTPAGSLRLFDVSALTRGVQDWAGPSLDLASPQRGGGGPLTGATFTLNEPRTFMGDEEVADRIRARVAPDTWADKSNAIHGAGAGLLLVRQKPEVLVEIERFLASLISAHLRTITTEVAVIGFRKGARAEWEKEIPALAPGGYFADVAPFDRLLEEAARRARVRLADRAEVTGFSEQRVHVLRSRQEAYVCDYEPQVSTLASIMDPIIGNFITGFGIDVQPRFDAAAGTVTVEFRGSLSSGALKDVDALEATAGGLQTAQARVHKWTATALCTGDRWSLVAIEMDGAGDDAEELAVFVRARVNR